MIVRLSDAKPDRNHIQKSGIVQRATGRPEILSGMKFKLIDASGEGRTLQQRRVTAPVVICQDHRDK